MLQRILPSTTDFEVRVNVNDLPNVKKAIKSAQQEIKMLQKFSEDFQNGSINRKNMKERLKEMKDYSFFDKTKIKMFLNAQRYMKKIEQEKGFLGKIAKRVPMMRELVQFIKMLDLMGIGFKQKTAKTIIVSVHCAGSERAKSEKNLAKTLKMNGVEKFEIKKIEKTDKQ